MKKIIRVLILFLVGVPLNAQEFQGKAEYFSKRIFKKGVAEVGVTPETDAKLKTAYEEALKKSSEKIFILTFNKKEALYEVQKTLEQPKPASGSVSVALTFSGEGKKYINIQDKVKIIEDDILGKEFLIVDPLDSFEWKLMDETKKMGDYTCYKAEVIIPVSAQKRKQYGEYLKQQETKPSLFKLDEPEETKIIAWYTPDIPVSLGPLNYWGLPGLILELSDGQTVVLCSKVVLGNKENSRIKVPNVGVKVSQDEFDARHKDKMDSIYGQ
jgi:GLPGLI family protein